MSDSEDFIALEMDNPTATRIVEDAPSTVELDMADRGMSCVNCGCSGPIDERGKCVSCSGQLAAEISATYAVPVAELARDLTAIATQGAANAAVAGIGSMRGGQLRGVGFSSRDGYLTAIRNGVPAHTYQSYVQTLRSQYGMTSADIAALNLPGPMAPTALPVGAGIKHAPTGPSIFDQPRAERAFVVGPTAEQAPAELVTLKHGDIVAGAVAEGNGALVGWNGTSGVTRGVLLSCLASAGLEDWAPRAASPHAHAGEVVGKRNQLGMVVRKAPTTTNGVKRWTIGRVYHARIVGASMGDIELRVKLEGDELTYEGSAQLGEPLVGEFNARMASEVYKSSDLTAWLAGTLRDKLRAVRFGVGWYVPARHATKAGLLCRAVADAGFGTDWILPALPVATSSQLQDGIVRGLQSEVDDLMQRLATERATAADARLASIAKAAATEPADHAAIRRAEALSGDIGQTRAGTFLRDLRGIAGRIIAYGQVLGEARVTAARTTVRDAIASLETLLADDHTGTGARFALIWEELQLDAQKKGEVL